MAFRRASEFSKRRPPKKLRLRPRFQNRLKPNPKVSGLEDARTNRAKPTMKSSAVGNFLAYAAVHGSEKRRCPRLKGTGDGAIVLTEESWVENPTLNFFNSCRQAVETWVSKATDLKLGCGISGGEATRISILGRPDYVGPCINEAAKIQQEMQNAVAGTRPIAESLYPRQRLRFQTINGVELAELWRQP